MFPAQMASSCCTTKGWARKRFDCARIAISSVDMRATPNWSLVFWSQLGPGVRLPLPVAMSPWRGEKS